ncbi:MAG: hypothetical protein A2516_10860 [Alphaproteobacteria bacterium RIFOXYD12_FULL_60_8]|nr:MAG: hypothetical protein A2516_10860 [Alphaproteobacteria bacterium RIFOXYD12_FULL_60_8]
MLDTAIFSWSENFRIGHGRIDQDHRAILHHLRALQCRPHAPCDVKKTLSTALKLRELCRSHFAEEEGLMRDFTDPVALVHRDIHTMRHGATMAHLDSVIAHLNGESEGIDLFKIIDRLTETLLMDITWLDFEMLTFTKVELSDEPGVVVSFPKALTRS